MARRQSSWDQIADELVDWVERESEAIVEALTGDGPAPFAANLSASERMQYFEALLFNPDGSPNVTGRNQLMHLRGPVEYARIMQIVLSSRGQGVGAAPIRRTLLGQPRMQVTY